MTAKQFIVALIAIAIGLVLPRKEKVVSRDDFLYVGKRGDVYVIVNRSASVDYPDEIGDDEHAITTLTRADHAVMEANRLQTTEQTEYGVQVAPGAQKVLGWVKKQQEIEV